MINIIKNELIKLYYKKKVFFSIIYLLLLSSATLIIFNFDSGDNKLKKSLNLLHTLEEKSSTLNNSEEKNNIDKRITCIKSDIDLYNNLKDENFDWKNYLKKKNNSLENLKKDGEISEMSSVKIEMNNYMIDNNIKPLSNYSIDNNNIFLNYISILGIIGILILVPLTTSSCISDEYTSENIQSLLLRPTEKFKLILGKLISNFIFLLGVIFIFDVIMYILSGFIFGFGNLNTPVLVQPKFTSSSTINFAYNQFITPISNTTHYISTLQLIGQSLLIQLLFTICCISFCTLISLLFKSNILSFAISLFLPLSCVFFRYVGFNEIKKYFCFLFPLHGDSLNIINGEFVLSTGAYFLTYNNTIFMLLLWTIVFLILMYLLRNKLSISNK